ncbi:hypothetical protein N752_24440 [Desulforamulus aquiferis]|nr:hypothetical protein N752_24440 [Desulforamulus aquiferis]
MNGCESTNLLKTFLTEFNNESDRACVILSAAMIESELEVLLKKSYCLLARRSMIYLIMLHQLWVHLVVKLIWLIGLE